MSMPKGPGNLTITVQKKPAKKIQKAKKEPPVVAVPSVYSQLKNQYRKDVEEEWSLYYSRRTRNRKLSGHYAKASALADGSDQATAAGTKKAKKSKKASGTKK